MLVGLIFGQTKLTPYVDPFIGTDATGHTFPGATVPFGMVQLSPDTDISGWDHCSGYHASVNSIMGFSHTHLSGTGGADYGDVLLLPFTGNIQWKAGARNKPEDGYRSHFSKEEAKAGYYSVYLDDYDVDVELTTSKRVGFHKYTFTNSNDGRVLVDLKHGISDMTEHSYLEVVSDREVRGLRQSRGWARKQYVYFSIVFSQPFKQSTFAIDDSPVEGIRAEGKNVKAVFDFDTSDRTLMAKVSISAVDNAGAKMNMDKEIPDWDFEAIVKAADEAWEERLNTIQVSGGTKEEKEIFYTALYHCFIHPNVYSDVDGRYRGRDLEIHQIEGAEYYTLFSLWDTFRALHPLFTLIAPEENQDFIKTMILQYEQGGDLPIWELAANETGTMIGYHSVPVIADAFMKGQRDFDVEKALEAMKNSAMRSDRGLEQYRKLGYIPADEEANSVSKCVEYAYDDWCIAQMAKALGKEEDYKNYIKRSQYYLNQFDPETGFMRGRLASGRWRSPFDPREVSHLGAADFTEGNSWQYSFFVPHSVNHLIELMGGDKAFVDKLDLLFNETEVLGLEKSPDVSGLIGNYAHGNEPSHHIAYLYNYAGAPWKTQQIVNQIKNELYGTGRDGLSGNEDCGQMSAWYVFSTLGFYPVSPGDERYTLGTPTFDRAVVNTGGDKPLVIETKKNSSGIYVQKAKLNRNDYSKNYLAHSDIQNGGTFEFTLGETPNKKWGSAKDTRIASLPVEEVNRIRRMEEKHVMMPYMDDEEALFSPSKTLVLNTISAGAYIRYTLDGSEPSETSKLYNGPFEINQTTVIKAIAVKEGLEQSKVLEREFTRVDFGADNNIQITLKDAPDPRYDKGGKLALLDRKLGGDSFHDGRWLGFEKIDMDAVIDLGEITEVASITSRYFKGQGAWIFLPRSVECFVSEDGKTFTSVAKETLALPTEMEEDEIRTVSLDLGGVKTRYLRLVAKNMGTNPDWHGGAGGRSWVFCDEIFVNAKK